ncbi:hypothetical protein D0Z07_1322, partial [Hyphodiscus hymeniophilus]
MASNTFPYEIKRLIYDYADLPTIKSLRQVSKAWALVGVELILLPTFHINSHLHDVQRLLDIGSHPTLSLQAVKVINKLSFQNTGWDSQYFRRIVCGRHEHRRYYEAQVFVPTEAEADALEELDKFTTRKDRDDQIEDTIDFLISALKSVPQVNSIEIKSRNLFENGLLRKVWEEYSLEAYRLQQHQTWKVLSAARTAGLNVHHFSHDQLISSCFEDRGSLRSEPMGRQDITSLKSLKLVISDHQGILSSADGAALIRLRGLLSAIKSLETLSITFEVLGSISLDFLPVSTTSALRSLTLSSFSLDPTKLLAFLEGHASTLRNLRLGWVDIPQGQGKWRDFLDDVRTLLGNTLAKFQVSGMLRSVDGDGEQWLLWPQYDAEWSVLEKQNSPRTKELEVFVLRDGPWPMVASD